MIICENCKKKHDGSYGTGRFCNTICSHSFSSKFNNKQRKDNISSSMKKKVFSNMSIEDKKKMTINANKTLKRKREKLYKEGKWSDLPLSYKRRRILEEQKGKCAICGIDEWQNKPIVLHYDHINGNNKNNEKENVRFICPNCHSQTETYCGKKQNLPQFEYLKTTKERLCSDVTQQVECRTDNSVVDSSSLSIATK